MFKGMRTSEAWGTFFAAVQGVWQQLCVEEPPLPRRRGRPRRYETGEGLAHHPKTAADMYRAVCYEALDLAVSSITDRVDQSSYAMYRELENLILKGLQKQECAEELTKVTEFYKEFD